MIQTCEGPVDLRAKREPQKIKLHRDKGGQERVIGKSWLKGDKQAYRYGVKQSMKLAAAQLNIQDLRGRVAKDPATNRAWTEGARKQKEQEWKSTLQCMRHGTREVAPRYGPPMASGPGMPGMPGMQLQKFTVMKRGSRSGIKKLQYFNIDTGKLKVYQSASSMAKVKRVYTLADAVGRLENYDEMARRGPRGMGIEPFYRDFKDRVRLTLAKGQRKGDLYLYADDATTAKNWVRAIKMSQYFENAGDREAISIVVRRLVGSARNKGWGALLAYANEIKETQRLVHNLSMRLLRADYSMAWTKARLVYQQKVESERVKKQQQEWAAKFLKEKLDRINSQAVRSPKLIRQSLIYLIQTKFRQYRQEKISDRGYPLGASVVTRVQQAQSGSAMGSAFTSATHEDTLHVVLNEKSRRLFQQQPEIFCGKTSSYSEVNIPVCHLGVNVSESFSMLSFAELDEDPEHTHLAKGGWANFVNLDQISSVILHSERKMNQIGSRCELQPSMTKGVWFTINGPRICWCRRIRSSTDPINGAVQKAIVGATNPLEAGNALSKSERLKWFKVAITVQKSSVPYFDFDAEEGEETIEGLDSPTDRMKQRHVYMILYLLGRTFRSDPLPGDSPTFVGRFEAEVPISSDRHALDYLDECEVGVDIVEAAQDPQDEVTIFAGKMPLWKMFVSDGATAAGAEGDRFDEVVSLSQTLGSGVFRHVKSIALSPPAVPRAENMAPEGWIDLEVQARVQETAAPRRSISPELHGRGPITSLFTTHRGAWYDPKLGESRFSPSHVASFVELSIGELQFPEADKQDPAKLYRYQIVAQCNGVKASTVPLHRARALWRNIIQVEPDKMDFEGAKLFLPLPPGAWCDDDVRPQIEIQVMRCLVSDEKLMSYSELLNPTGRQGLVSTPFERVYHAIMQLDHEIKESAAVAMSVASAPEVRVNLGTGKFMTVAESQAVLKLEAALRDRDYVFLHTADRAMSDGLGQGFVLCVGDKAMLRVEEPLSYPQNEIDYRRRFFPGSFDTSQAQRENSAPRTAAQPAWTAPLRDPSMSHEYSMSGLGSLKAPPAFKQRHVPAHCDDIVPCKFVLPKSELDFMRQAKPGVYWRIVENLVGKSVREGHPLAPDTYSPVVVEELSHLIRHVPCTVLAVYADDTCDLEVGQSFLREWEKHKDRRYTIPGWVMTKPFIDESPAAVRAAPPGVGDMSQHERMRVVLKEVPIRLVVSVQQASFNIYDARFANVDEAIKVPPSSFGNDFDPRGPADFDDKAFLAGRRGGYSLAVGPVPADVGPTCWYEWSLHLHAQTEDDMHQFVTNLRLCARMNVQQKRLKLAEWKKRSALAATALPYQMGEVLTTSSGHLEVVLIEARHLRPPRVMKDQDAMAGITKMMAAQLTTMASFQIKQSGKPLPYRGSTMQFAPLLTGDSPNWSEVKELKASGGWVFKTRTLDPRTQEDVVFEVELLNKYKKPVGIIRIDAMKFRPEIAGMQGPSDHSENGVVNLCSSVNPFNDMWLPLCTVDPEDPTNLIPDVSAKVHIMTLWVPQQQQNARQKRLPKKAVEWTKHLMQHSMASLTVREHLSATVDVQARKRGYDPNLWQDSWPVARSAFMTKHMEMEAGSRPYLACCEFFDRKRQQNFMELLESRQWDTETPLSEYREMWSHDQQDPSLPMLVHSLDELFRRGIAPGHRKAAWMDIVLANKTIDYFGGGSAQSPQERARFRELYRELVSAGRNFKSVPITQLSEDIIGAFAWEGVDHMSYMDKHLDYVMRSQDICIALITFSQDKKQDPKVRLNYTKGEHAGGVAYCESLLSISFYLLLAFSLIQTAEEVKRADQMEERKRAEARQKRRDDEEAHVFWLLYALIGSPFNGAYFDYFGTVQGNVLGARAGVMEDISRLSSCLAQHDRDVWIYLNGLGFHLSMPFYGAFIRLFSSYLPTTSCFRFWDLLFSESAPRKDRPPQKIPRHSLIDLAFAVMKRCRTELLGCQSAVEATQTIVNCLEHMYDPTEVITITYEAEHLLWDAMAQSAAESMGIPSHMKEYERGAHLWDQFLLHFRRQNEALQGLVCDPTLTLTPSSIGKVLRSVRALFHQENSERGTYIGMQHMVPASIRKLGPDLDRSWVGTLSTWFGRMTGYGNEAGLRGMHPIAFSIPRFPEMSPGSIGEPTQMDRSDFERQIGRVASSAGQDWNHHFQKIASVFVSPTDGRLSANEFFTSLVAISKGTVGEKAIELFKIFAGVHQKHKMLHHIPVTHAANTIIDKQDWKAKKAEGMITKAPKPAEYKNFALYFKIWTNSIGADKILLGEAFVPNLRQYMWHGMDREVAVDHKIFSMETVLPPGISMTSGNAQALMSDIGVRQEIGVMHMAIKWMPASENTPEVGQLGIRLKFIDFNPTYVQAQRFKNPKVEVFTFDDAGQEQRIKRWDPRTALRKGASFATDGIVHGGSFGEYLEFEETERRKPNGSLVKRIGAGEGGHGYYEEPDPQTGDMRGRWKWSQKHGDQYSVQGVRMRAEYLKAAALRPNTIPLRACRMITRIILSRSMYTVTNRQAMQIADHAFNRAGAVPGILDAILVKAEGIPGDLQTAAQLKERLASTGTAFVDVTHQMIIAHEESMEQAPGNITLFPTLANSPYYNLASMEVNDPFPGAAKILWLRYCRAGDGQRFNARISVDANGSFPPQNLRLDMETDSVVGKIQMSLTKEEFVSCILTSPILSESLRRLSTVDNDMTHVVKEDKCLRLDVTIPDPMAEQDTEEMLDMFNVRQGIVFELWDKDRTSRDDFLGECWLPPLASLKPTPQTYSLTVHNADESNDPTLSRPDKQKHGLAPGICKGILWIEASWTFPAEEVPDVTDEDDQATRVAKETAMHTGQLYLKIIKAENLRAADIRRQQGSDPYVLVYQRNETIPDKGAPPVPGLGEGGWHVGQKTGLHDWIMRTSVKSSTTDPVWEEDKVIQIQTGSFERRSKRAWSIAGQLDITGRTAQTKNDDHTANVLAGSQEGSGWNRHGKGELHLYFGEDEFKACGGMTVTPGTSEGYRHRVRVVISDTIHSFKAKLREACDREVSAIDKLQKTTPADDAKRASYLSLVRRINYMHIVMVFVPSQRLRELSQAHRESDREYRRLYGLELQDPNSWQPLHQIRDFESYRNQYGFGAKDAALLRVVEGTADYKHKNARYRDFLEEQKAWKTRVEHLNNEGECFGYAKYKHKGDGFSTEWRCATIDRPEIPAGEVSKRFRACFIHAPGLESESSAASSTAAAGQVAKDVFNEDEVLLAPLHPRINDSDRQEHVEFLARVPEYRDQGLTDAQIVAVLNKEMKAQHAQQVFGYAEEGGIGPCTPITLADVQQELKRLDAFGAAQSPSRIDAAASSPSNSPTAASPVR